MWLSVASLPPTPGLPCSREKACSELFHVRGRSVPDAKARLQAAAALPSASHPHDHIFLSPLASCHPAGIPSFRQDGSPVPGTLGIPKDHPALLWGVESPKQGGRPEGHVVPVVVSGSQEEQRELRKSHHINEGWCLAGSASCLGIRGVPSGRWDLHFPELSRADFLSPSPSAFGKSPGCYAQGPRSSPCTRLGHDFPSYPVHASLCSRYRCPAPGSEVDLSGRGTVYP